MLKRALVAAGLLSPLAAHADPATIVFVLKSSVEIFGFSVSVSSLLIASAFVVTSINARRNQRKAAAAARAAYNAGVETRYITALSAAPPWRINYGRFTAGGDILDILTSDKTTTKEIVLPGGGGYGVSNVVTKPDAYKHLVIHLATHEIEAIHEVYIDGVAVGALDANGWATGSEFGSTQKAGRVARFTTTTTLTEPVVDVLSCYETDPGQPWVHTDVTPTLSGGNLIVTVPAGKTVTFNYTVNETKSTVRVMNFLGSDTQSLASYLQSIAPAVDSTASHFRGLACVVLTLDLEDQRFQGGSNQITIDRSGKKLYDPRTGLTTYSNNWALCVRDFLTGEYGYECTDADIDDEYTIAAANASDVQRQFTAGDVTFTGPTYTINGMITTDQPLEPQLQDLEEAGAGKAVYGGKWMIMAGAWTPPVTLPGGGGLTDADLDGQIEVVQAGPGVDELFNGCRGTLIPRGAAQPTDADPYQNPTFLAADGRPLWEDFTLPFTDDKARAKQLFRVFTERGRIAQVIRVPCKLRAWPLRVGDRVQGTFTEPPFVGTNFRVTDWQFGITSPVVLTLERDEPEVYDEADASTANLVANPNLPNPWVVAAMTGLTASSSASTMVKSGTSGSLVARVLLTWDAITDVYVKNSPGYIEILWRRANQDFQRITWPGDQASAEIVGVNDGDRLVIKVRAVNGIGGAGPWVYLAHTVNGPTTIATPQLGTEAATAVRSTTASGVTITGRSGAPNTATARWTTIASISFTPDIDGELTVHGNGELETITAASGAGEDIATGAICVDTGTISAANIQRIIDIQIGYSKTVRGAISITRRFALTGGVAYTISLRGQGTPTNNTITAVLAELRIEFIKR